MKSCLKGLIATGLVLMATLPSLALAKPSANCKVDPQEFVYVQLNMGNKINYLQKEAIQSKNYDNDTRQALVKLSEAYSSVYDDAGKYGASHDSMSYSPEKLQALRDAAARYYYYYCRKMDCNSKNAEVGYILQEMAILAVDEFDSQCRSKTKRAKNWVDKWNRIDKGVSAQDVQNNRKNSRDDDNSRWVAQNPYEWNSTGTIIYHPTQQYPNQQYPTQQYPNQQYPNQQYPNQQYPNQQHPQMPPAMHQQFKCGLTDTEFSNLKQAVKKASFDSDKTVVLKTAIPTGTFYVSQAVELLKMMSSDQSKASMGNLFANRICDCQNWYQIYNAFTFDSSKKSFTQTCSAPQPQMMNHPHNGYGYGRACGMNDSDFNQLKQSVKKSSFDSGKVSILQTAVPSNTFYVSQAVELMKMLDSDSNKVTVGELIYKQVCDPQNWYQIYSAFTFDSGKHELARKLGME